MDDQHRVRDGPEPEKREHFLKDLKAIKRIKKLQNWEF